MTLVLFVLLLIGQAAVSKPAGCQSEGPAVRAVRTVAEGIVAADNARDLNRVQASYTPDAVLIPPNESPVRGWDSIRPRYEALFAGFSPAIEGHLDEVCVSGQVAFVRGRNLGSFVSRGPQPSRTLNDVYLMLLRFDERGAWRISHLMWHPAAPPAPRN
jgi:uncharacterized protein (TIGR02246 family)